MRTRVPEPGGIIHEKLQSVDMAIWLDTLGSITLHARLSRLDLVIVQGDTEFGSVEQQRLLVITVPSEHDFKSLILAMREEMRHGCQMCHVMINHFGSSGKIESEKILHRSADQQGRLLGSFNENVDHWPDFFVYTELIDHNGKYQLTMLSQSAFAPLARSMGPMLKGEAFHSAPGTTDPSASAGQGRCRCGSCRNTSTSGSRPPMTSSVPTPPVWRTGPMSGGLRAGHTSVNRAEKAVNHTRRNPLVWDCYVRSQTLAITGTSWRSSGPSSRPDQRLTFIRTRIK